MSHNDDDDHPHHQNALTAQNSLILSRHPSPSSIDPGRSSSKHSMSVQS